MQWGGGMFDWIKSLLRPEPEGPPQRISVVDGDTFRIGAERLRIMHMDAPESGQLDAKGRDLGALAKVQMQTLIEGRPVSITRHGKDVYGRTLAQVSTDQVRDVALEMVQRGYAVALNPSPPVFNKSMQRAILDGKGLWENGAFELPSLWRQRQVAATGKPWVEHAHRRVPPALVHVGPEPKAFIPRVPPRSSDRSR